MKSVFAALLLFAAPIQAFAAGTDDAHVRSAFVFAHKKRWPDAIEEARAAHSRVLVKYFTWNYLKDPQSDAGFAEINHFIEENPSWPDQAALLKRAEVALLAGNPSDETLERWFSEHPPQTSIARMRGVRNDSEVTALIREAWVTDDYDKTTEGRLLDKYHGILREQDHVRRIDRLLWEGRTEDAKRLLKYVHYDYQRLFQARIALADDKSNAPTDVVNITPELSRDAGLLYQRLLWRSRRGDRDGVRELLLQTPKEVPYPEKWWPMRDRQIRQALGENDVKLASRLLVLHGQNEDSVQYREVQWLSGWIALEYLNQPGKALTNFSWLYKNSSTAASKARAAYWAGRASKDDSWFERASAYPTTFYGQVAIVEMNRKPMLKIASDEDSSGAEQSRFGKKELVQLVFALRAAQEADAAGKFITYLVENADSAEDAAQAVRLGRDIGRIDFSVRAAKKALQKDVIALKSGWPVIRFEKTQGLEVPLLLGLSRQESEFNADAISPSGAVGLMQLLPSTAKEVARKNDYRYTYEKLFEPNFNMAMGNLYLGKLVDKFSGSYVLAIASYNAGPGRVGQWLDMYGRPGSDLHDVLNWIERIPFPETRNYVQHVLENLQVYRYLLAGKASSPLKIGDDLIR